MQPTRIILNVHGCTVQDVFCSDPNAHVQIVDWDVSESDADAPGLVEVNVEQGRKQRAFVGGLVPNPLAHLAGTDVEKALQAAEVLDGAT
ncbi:MAG: hypothetical protein K8T91_10860 [Planctomycetes bacterium]|nr:hypothetical protein [Planctomycetota bacterium]